MATQTIGSLSFTVPAAPVAATAATEVRASTLHPSLGVGGKVELYLTPTGDIVAQRDTLTITAGVAGDDYVVSVSTSGGVNDPESYTYTQETEDTASTIATKLAAILTNNESRVVATAVAGVITLVGATPGQAITYSVANSTVPANAVLANTVAAAGTAIHRKIGEAIIKFAVNSNNAITMEFIPTFYAGDSVPTVLSGTSATVVRIHPYTLGQIATNNGITIS